MADLTFLEEQPGTVDAVNLDYEARRVPRDWLGLSQAGHECKRYLWYTHNGYQGKPIEGRVLRLFQLGNVIEDQVIADLMSAGVRHYAGQREVKFTQDGVELVGHIDGIVEGLIESPATPHLFECKSASDKKFRELVKLGDYEKWNPVYGFQVQAYMLGLKLKRAAVFVYNKNTSEMKLFRVKLRREETIKKLQGIFEAITSPVKPDRKCPRADYYKAKWCDFREICFGCNYG